jgi:hypothetical protein
MVHQRAGLRFRVKGSFKYSLQICTQGMVHRKLYRTVCFPAQYILSQGRAQLRYRNFADMEHRKQRANAK